MVLANYDTTAEAVPQRWVLHCLPHLRVSLDGNELMKMTEQLRLILPKLSVNTFNDQAREKY